MVKSQVKFWVFAAAGTAGLYLVALALFQNRGLALGLALMAGALVATILGLTWNAEKESETAATYKRRTRDEEARQAFMNVQAKGAKQIEAPAQQPAE